MLSTTPLVVDEVDGVPLVMADGPPPASCYLAFRVGWADEPLHLRGITHLVEHLALSQLGDQPYEYNGFVDPVRTVFHATGDPADLSRFLATVTEALTTLPFDRIVRERDILRAEAAGRSAGIVGALLGLRYGPQGYGGVASPELGLSWVDEPALEAWRARFFTRGNAVIWTTTPTVVDGSLALALGPRMPAPVPQEVIDLPAATTTGWAGVAVSTVADRSLALTVGLEVLRRRSFRELRERRGLSYGVTTDVLTMGAVRRHIVLSADSLPQHVSDTTRALVETLQSTLDSRTCADDVAVVRDALGRQWSGWNATSLEAFVVADDLLHGSPARPLREQLQELRAVEAADVVAALRSAEASLLLAVQSEAEVPEGFRRVSDSSPKIHRGRVFERVGQDARTRDRLFVGRDGVTLRRGDTGHVVSVAREDCLAMGWWADGTRRLWGRDGFVIEVHPPGWGAGEALVNALDALYAGVPSVPMGADSGYQSNISPPVMRPAFKRLLLVMGGLISLVLLMMGPLGSPTFETAYSEPVAAVPGALSGVELCGGSSLAVWTFGADIDESVTPQHRAVLRAACQEEAQQDVAASGAGAAGIAIVSTVAVAGYLRRRRDSAAEGLRVTGEVSRPSPP